jgi:hypothetical protein
MVGDNVSTNHSGGFLFSKLSDGEGGAPMFLCLDNSDKKLPFDHL